MGAAKRGRKEGKGEENESVFVKEMPVRVAPGLKSCSL